MPEFKSVRFMSAQDKQAVFRDWNGFLVPLAMDDPGDRLWNAFMQRLYYHLTQHCWYIAHYSRAGFHETYFADPEDTPNFLQQFDRDKGHLSYEYGGDDWLCGDYEDINRAMCAAFEPRKLGIYAALDRRIRVQKQGQIEKLKRELEEWNS